MNAEYGLIEIGWQGGVLHLQYTAIQNVDETARGAISEVMRQFADECQMMLVWYAGVLRSREMILRHLSAEADSGQPITVSGVRPDGATSVWARVSRDRALSAFSEDGDFQRLYGKAFVIFVYQVWDDFARPRIAEALTVAKEDVQSDFMGDWRLLRHWIVHQGQKAEQDYFDRAKEMPRMLNLQRGTPPEITADMIFALMERLNSLQISVNPESQEPAFKKVSMPPEIAEEIAKQAAEEGYQVLSFPSLRPIRRPPSTPE